MILVKKNSITLFIFLIVIETVTLIIVVRFLNNIWEVILMNYRISCNYNGKKEYFDQRQVGTGLPSFR